jgi:chaperone modulatory protein CbpM
MTRTSVTLLQCQVVEDEVEMTLAELCRACDTDHDLVRQLVALGVLEPRGEVPEAWVFIGASLRRTRLAVRLVRDLELNLPGVALAVELLDEIERLRREPAAAPGSR